MPYCCACHAAATAMALGLDRSKYRYYPEDFAPSPTRVMFMDLDFDLDEARAIVEAHTTFVHNPTDGEELTVLRLDSNGLSIHEVEIVYDDGKMTKLDACIPNNDWLAHCDNVATLPKVKLVDATATAPKATGPTAVGLGPSPDAGTYVVNLEDNKLLLTLPRPVKAGEQFVVRTLTTAIPSSTVLEGLYYDYQPEGGPRALITQCQQYGFQRMVPSIDSMMTKCGYRTSVTADSRFTSLVTNGDMAPEYRDADAAAKGEQIPRPQPAAPYRHAALAPEPTYPRVRMVYHNWDQPMAPYLFFLGAGTYTTYRRVLEYPDGDVVQIELLVFPGEVVPREAARKLDMIAGSVLYTYLNLGREACQHQTERARVWKLIAERDALLRKKGRIVYGTLLPLSADTPLVGVSERADNGVVVFPPEDEDIVGVADGKLTADEEKRLAAVRTELKQLMKAWGETGYKYDATVYREIAMQFSSYGGMENRMCTTIISSAIAPKIVTTDQEYVYMEAVTAHEFGHSQNGSAVTGNSPFSIFLNEAVTVQTYERLRCDALFGHEFMRLSQVAYALTPATGPLAVDEMPGAMAVVPDGFNTTLELITAMTYSKAPEFVSMIKLMMGEDAFNKSLANYFERYALGNATREQWLACMEEGLGRSLERYAEGWLRRSGHPVVFYSTSYDAATKRYTISMRQTGFEGRGDGQPWEFPVSWAAVRGGRVLGEGVYVMDTAEATIEVECDEQPEFASVGRDWSFFGRVVCEDSDAVVTAQALSDPDAVCRMLAYRTLSDRERTRLLRALVEQPGQTPTVSDAFVEVTATILFDSALSPATRQIMLAIPDAVNDAALAAHYWALADVRQLVYRAVVAAHHERMVALLHEMDAPETRTGAQLTHMHHRALKGLLIAMLDAAYSFQPQLAPKVNLPAFLVALLRESTFATDKINAVNALSAMAADESCERLVVPDRDDGYNQLSVPADVEAMVQPETLSYFSGEAPVSVRVPTIHPADKARALAFAKQYMYAHPDGVSTFFGIMASSPAGVHAATHSSTFRVELPAHARAVARNWAARRRLSLLTVQGLAATGAVLKQIASVNEMSATALVQACGDVARFSSEARTAVLGMLQDSYDTLMAQGKNSITKAIKAMIDSGRK